MTCFSCVAGEKSTSAVRLHSYSHSERTRATQSFC